VRSTPCALNRIFIVTEAVFDRRFLNNLISDRHDRWGALSIWLFRMNNTINARFSLVYRSALPYIIWFQSFWHIDGPVRRINCLRDWYLLKSDREHFSRIVAVFLPKNDTWGTSIRQKLDLSIIAVMCARASLIKFYTRVYCSITRKLFIAESARFHVMIFVQIYKVFMMEIYPCMFRASFTATIR